MSAFEAPLFLRPIMVERVWGGKHLARMFGKDVPAEKVIGESWELADRPEAQSVVDGGPHDGQTLRSLLEKFPKKILGSLAAKNPQRFPLLIKYIDAGTALSVQVHPDDEGARPLNDRGKSECWVVLHAEPEAKIIRGLKPGTTRADYEAAVAQDRVEDVLHSFTPQVGDVVALPAGMVHAIGAGLVVAEVQQNSDITFRIYDYKRLGLDGKPRKLHVQEALGAIRFDVAGPEFHGDMKPDTVKPQVLVDEQGFRVEHLLEGMYFHLGRFTLEPKNSAVLPFASDAPLVLMVLKGTGNVAGRAIRAGQTALIPAAVMELEFEAGDDGLVFLVGRPTAAAC